MRTIVQPTHGFPMTRIPSRNGGLPVDVCLVAQLGPGGGDHLFASACEQQRRHASFVDALDEPSAKLFGVDLSRADATSVYSFAVDANGHPFHRHAGHRVFTAISGSGGTRLHFSMATDAEIADEPEAFVAHMHGVDIPPDCLFTVRFGGGTWHQFSPRQRDGRHPAFFALSCHTNELGGIEDAALAEAIGNDAADIPGLTELPPGPVQNLLAATPLHARQLSITALALHAAPESLTMRTCAAIRARTGRIAGKWAASRRASAFVGRSFHHAASAVSILPNDSLLAAQFPEGFDHQDTVALELHDVAAESAQALLADVLGGFLQSRPLGVSWLMQLRNLLVRPLRLRTSPLGCPVSSLLSDDARCQFAGRYPVLDAHIDHGADHAEVLLGADDRHLRFRTCVRVERMPGGYRILLGTRVHCTNAFGKLYMALIENVHRRYIAPTLLERAAAHALQMRDALPAARLQPA